MGGIAKVLVEAGYGERVMKIVGKLAEDDHASVREALIGQMKIIAKVLVEAGYGERVIWLKRRLGIENGK